MMDIETHNLINKIEKQLPKGQTLFVRYYGVNGVLTYIMSKNILMDTNKKWVLWSVDDKCIITKVAQHANPLVLEEKIDYLNK